MAQQNQNQRNREQHGGGGGGQREKPQIVPWEYKGIPFVIGGNINPELVGKIAEDIVDDFRMKVKISSAQLRRFYGEVKDYSNQLNNGVEYKKLYPLIKMLKSMAYYAYNRNKIPLKFANFLVGLIDQVKENEELTFKAAAKHFEAVVGYMYGKGLVSK